jgi:opacity protein-like surface antigen
MRIRKSVLLGGSALMLVLSSSSGAWAQNCVTTASSFTNPLLASVFNTTAAFSAATASAAAGSFSNVSTAFLAQQGSAFVANPVGTPPDSPGGGVWVRGVGGEVRVDTNSVTSATETFTATGLPSGNSATIACASRGRQTFGGVQVGADVARLNMGGWNVNVGTTAGYLEADSRDVPNAGGILRTHFEVPFAGVYAVVTKGGFFADAMFRGEFYNIDLNEPGFNIFNQGLSAHGHSFSIGAGYHFALPSDWFIEPSAGFIWSRTEVDDLNLVAPVAGAVVFPASGTLRFDTIESQIGRLSVRVGTSYTSGNFLIQPFASASVFHEFADPVRSTYTTCLNCTFLGFTDTFATSSSRIGTYGQFSLGLAGQLLNTGWVGFLRGDYRTGDRVEGWTANGGIRYNFVPAAVAAPLITKGPPVPPPVTVVNWTGFYVGGFLGADFGQSQIDLVSGLPGLFPGSSSNPRIAGIIGGGQVGFNWQIGRAVLGIEGDIGATNKKGTQNCGTETGFNAVGAAVAPTFTPFFLACSNSMDWVATLAARVGFTWERALFYVKGGGAWTHQDVTVSCIFGPLNNAPLSAPFTTCFNPGGVITNGFAAQDDRFGGLIGVGVEFALASNWSAKAEYNFIEFGRDNLRATDGTLLSVDTHINEVKVGVNYRFGPMSPF